MKLGFVTAILPDLTFDEVAAFAARAGYSCVEVMSWPQGKAERRYAGVTHIDASDLSDGAVARIKGTLDKERVSISAIGYYPNPLSSDAQEAETAQAHLLKLIAAARALDVGTVTTFVGRDPKLSVDDNWPRFLNVWRPIIKQAEDAGVRIAIENCPMLFTADEWPGGKNLATSPAIWQRMFNDIDSPSFGLNFDPSHFVWQRMDYLQAVRDFAPKIFHAHAKDARVDTDKLNKVGLLATPLEFHTPKLPGLGDVDWGAYISVLGDSGYNGPLCVEVEDRIYEGSTDKRKSALEQSHRFLSRYLPLS